MNLIIAKLREETQADFVGRVEILSLSLENQHHYIYIKDNNMLIVEANFEVYA